MNTQEQVNKFSKLLRMQVIEFLVKEDVFKYRGERLNDADLAMTVMFIDKIPCCTRKLRSSPQSGPSHKELEARQTGSGWSCSPPQSSLKCHPKRDAPQL